MLLFKLEKVSRFFQVILVIFSIISVSFLGYLDYRLGYEFYISFFYFFPVIFTTWFFGVIPALLVSFWAALMELLNHLFFSLRPSPPVPMLVWDFIILMASCGLIIYFLKIIQDFLVKERESARIDPLTTLPNRRFFYSQADIEINRAKRFTHPLSIAYIDVDNFKQVNDTMGHQTGDLLLAAIAKTLKSNLRDYDIPARFGGDEFVILFPEINEIQIKTAIDKIRDKVVEIIQENHWPVTLSIGVLTVRNLDKVSLEEMIRKSDQLMYSVKKNGKNSIVFLYE